MQGSGKDIVIGVDAGTSVIKSIAFDLTGRQIASACVPNRYETGPEGAVFQPLEETWTACAGTLHALGDKVPDLARRTAALAITAQGDGTWLVGKDDKPVDDGWLWLDSRAAPTVKKLRARPEDRARFEATGTGLNSCQMGTQLAHMEATTPEKLAATEVALHCKDWLYLKLTGERVADPSEAVFTFGNFRTAAYDDAVIEALGLTKYRRLLPEIVDGTETFHPLSGEAATATGLLAGTPVVLGFVDVICTALGAGIYSAGADAGCSIIGSTGVHMRAVAQEDVVLNGEATGYVMMLPIPGKVAQLQSNMAATLNIDWLLALAADLASDLGVEVTPADLVSRLDGWLDAAAPGQMIYQPYISEAGERGPFVNNAARAGFSGLNSSHRFPDLARAVVEGLGLAARDCYGAMGPLPGEVRLTGGAARSPALRAIMAAAIGAPIRRSGREEAGAAGAAMMAAVAIGAQETMDACVEQWVVPLLGEAEPPDPQLRRVYDRLFPAYQSLRHAAEPVWSVLSEFNEVKDA
jgi:erythritol kinase